MHKTCEYCDRNFRTMNSLAKYCRKCANKRNVAHVQKSRRNNPERVAELRNGYYLRNEKPRIESEIEKVLGRIDSTPAAERQALALELLDASWTDWALKRVLRHSKIDDFLASYSGY